MDSRLARTLVRHKRGPLARPLAVFDLESCPF
jgi:hypothetical protein